MTSSGVNNSKSELNTKFNEMNFDEDVVEDFTALKVVHESVLYSQTFGTSNVQTFGNAYFNHIYSFVCFFLELDDRAGQNHRFCY